MAIHDQSSWPQFNANVLLRQPNSCRKVFLSNQRGQIVVEYVLLLVIAIGIATLITKSMISSDPANPGFVMSAWSHINQAIGADHADDIERGGP